MNPFAALILQAHPEPASRIEAWLRFAHEVSLAPGKVSEPGLGEIRLKWWSDAALEVLDTGTDSSGSPRAHPAVMAFHEAIQGAEVRPAPGLVRAFIDAHGLDLETGPMRISKPSAPTQPPAGVTSCGSACNCCRSLTRRTTTPPTTSAPGSGSCRCCSAQGSQRRADGRCCRGPRAGSWSRCRRTTAPGWARICAGRRPSTSIAPSSCCRVPGRGTARVA